MNCRLSSTVFLACLLGCAAGAAAADGKSRFAGTGSGWGNASFAPDLEGEGGAGTIAELEVRSSEGKLDVSLSQTVLPWDEMSFCEIDGGPGIELQYSSTTGIYRAANGDLIYTRLDPSQSSTACIAFDFRQGTFEVFEVITGGTGKYEGATGAYAIRGSAEFVSPVHSAIQAEIDGELFRATRP